MGKGNVGQTGIASLAHNLLIGRGIARIHRNAFEAVLLHALGGKETGTVPLHRQSHHHDGAGLAQQGAHRVDVVAHSDIPSCLFRHDGCVGLC